MPSILVGRSSRQPTATTDPGTAHPLLPPRRRRSKKPSPSRRNGSWGLGGGRRSGSTTPLLRWKFDDDDTHVVAAPAEGEKKNAAGRSGRATAGPPSARKLATGIWHLQQQQQMPQVAPPRLGFQVPHLCNWKVTDPCGDPNDGYSSSASVSNSRNGALHKNQRCAELPNPVMERATKWDPGLSTASEEVLWFYGHLKLLEDQQLSSILVISSLTEELERAQLQISELEDDRRLSKKKLDHFLGRLTDEKAAWRSREHEKVRTVIDDMKHDLNEEKRHWRRLEVMNVKLVSEIKEAKLTAKQYLQDYEKEKKARELMEEVCNELAKEIEEDKAEVEALKMESMKIREEVEEERKMMQMAEVWREERVQMKLNDAKLSLEEKYMQMSRLQSDIESFHKTHMPNGENTGEAELLKEAINSIKVHDVEFSYHPPTALEDIFSVFEELNQLSESHEKEMIGPCYGYSPTSHASKIHMVSPETDAFTKAHVMKIANKTVHCEEDLQDESGWETISPGDELGYDSSEPFPNGACLEHNASTNTKDWMEDMDNGNAYSSIETYSEMGKQSRKKGSSIARFWRTSCPTNGENYKTVAVDVYKYQLQNGRLSNPTMSPERGPGVVDPSPADIEHCSSPNSVKQHITRGRKGCIEWPKAAQKQGLKGKLFEARIDCQKVQLRQVLKQKF